MATKTPSQKTPSPSKAKAPVAEFPQHKTDPRLDALVQGLSAEEKAEWAKRFDGWSNILTGLGLKDRDKRTSNTFRADCLSWTDAQELWRGNDMAAKIITKVPKEMLRRGYDVRIQGEDAESSKEQEEAIETSLTALEANAQLQEALNYERAYGGGAVLLGAQDGAKKLSEPLNENRLESIDFLTTLPAQELYVSGWYSNPLAPKYGKPALYRLQPQGYVDARAINLEIHESRLLLFPGVVVSRVQAQQNQGWGDSVLVRVNEALSDFGATWGGTANLLTDFAQSIYKIKGLAALVAANKDNEVMKRIQLIDLMRSLIRGVILDENEDYERKTTSLAGLPDILDKFMLRLAAAAEMPVSLLMGQAPAGLNATGASDIRFFYDDVAGEQTAKLLPRLSRLVRLLCRAKRGPTRGKEPKKWSVVFRPLWQMTEAEQEDLKQKVALRDQIYINTGVLSPEEVAMSRFGGDTWSPETVIDLAARQRLQAATPATPEPTPPPDPKKDAARKDAGQGGIMVALYPPKETALDLVVPGGEPANELHLTLCYLGPLTDGVPPWIELLQQVVAAVASRAALVEGVIAGVGRFPASPSSQGLDVLWAAVDALNLPRLREALVSAIEGARLPYSTEHGFQPHITLAYLSPEEESPLTRLAPRPARFTELTLVVGDTRYGYPLGGVP